MVPVENKILIQIEFLARGVLMGSADFSGLRSSKDVRRSILKLEKDHYKIGAGNLHSHERNLCLFRNFPKFKVLKI